MKIYTRLGDRGSTMLANGKKLSKATLRVNCYGEVDELNSYLGFCRDSLRLLPCEGIRSLESWILTTQNELFCVGSELALAGPAHFSLLSEKSILRLEEQIDEMWSQLPALTSFVLPGGHQAASSLHVARSICRRVERLLVSIKEAGEEVRDLLISYFNRLSDWLFCSARFALYKLGGEEILWKSKT